MLRHRGEIGRLSIGIRRIIEIMKQEDLLAEDVKEEYRRLVREKEQLQALCEKLELDLERRRKRVLNAELISRSLQDFARLVNLLPLDDQKELCQLLLREVEVMPYNPDGGEAPLEEGAFATKVNARWYRVKLTLYQLPGVPLVNQTAASSDKKVTGSPSRIRTYNQPVNSRLLYH